MNNTLDRNQKQQIEAAKESGMDVTQFLNGDYSWAQISIIRMAYEDGVDLTIYGPNVSPKDLGKEYDEVVESRKQASK